MVNSHLANGQDHAGWLLLSCREEFAKLVGVDLFRFMESFQKTAMGDHLVVPANALDR